MDNIYIPDKVGGKEIGEKHREELTQFGRTKEKIEGFFSSEKEQYFDAFLMVKKGKVLFDDIEYHNKRSQNELNIPSTIFGRDTKPEWVQDLKAGKKTELIKGFMIDGKETEGHLIWNESNKKIILLPPEQTKDVYNVPKKIFGVTLTENQRETLSVLNKETELIEGFKLKNPPRVVDAHLSVVKADNKYHMNFRYIEREKSLAPEEKEEKKRKKSGGLGLSKF